MFEHSVKVPRSYKVAANIVKKVASEGGSVKTLLYDDKLKHYNTNVLYALITKTIQHAAELDKIFELCSLFKTEARLDPWLAKVLATELLFGKKALPGKSKPELTIISYKEQFEKYTTDRQDEKPQVRRPRYVRINTNLLTTSDAIRAFQDEGYRFIRCTSGSYDDYLKQIQELTEYAFTQDYHVKTMFVFAAGTRLHEHDLYLENKIILQDKATAMAVHLLAPPPGSVVLDMCAAPGMKTTQLAAFMRNQGKIYAVERNETRYQTLCEFVEKTGAKCVETLLKDSLEMRRGDYDDVEYILLDPSCSGSGMELSVHNYIEDTRLAKLTSLQEKFLKHAMNAFPKAKRIVYSTCSLFPEENERVITNVVKTSRAKWRVQDVKELLKGQWNNFGSGMYGSIGPRCMYARPDSDLTIGFFLAVLDRDPKDLEKSQNSESKIKNRDAELDIISESKDNEEVSQDNPIENGSIKKKEKKDKKKQNLHENSENIEVDSIIETSVPKKEKIHKCQNTELDCDNQIEENAEAINGVEPATETDVPKKKKKKDKYNKNFKTDNLDEMEPPTDIQNDTEKTKKKKKHKSESNDPYIEEEEPIEYSKEPFKKKKKKHKETTTDVDESVIETQNIEICEEPIMKKKKHKEATIDVDESVIETQNIEICEEPKQKKKKHKKATIDVDESVIETQNIEMCEAPKKKKKKRNTDAESS